MTSTLTLLLFTIFSHAAETPPENPFHFTADKSLYDSKKNRYELIGNAAVHQRKESLYADKIIVELDTKLVHAVGNASYISDQATIQGSEMHFNLDTRTGTVLSGRVSTRSFTLTGELINKLGANRFQTHRGDFTTCKDCPQSWSLYAEDVDLEIEGYAHLSNVKVKISDAPALWFPYLIVPIKTKRQSGLLMPRFGFSNLGFTYVQPFFWAINRSSDMTFGLGTYGGQGQKLEWEGRYALADGQGSTQLHVLEDRTFRGYLADRGFRTDRSAKRWGLTIEQNQEWFFGVQQKLRVKDTSDSLYPTSIRTDLPANGEAFFGSDLSFTRTTDKVSTIVSAKRYRSLLTPIEASATRPSIQDPRDADKSTVQIFPQAVMTTNDKLFFGGAIAGNMNLGVTNFIRQAGPFDRDPNIPPASLNSGFRLGQDPIREATRFTLNPTLYSTLRPADVLTWVPSIQYKHYYYNFKDNVAPPLSRGYLHFQSDLWLQLEKIYDNDSEEIPKSKHLIRPKISYTLIPYRREPKHPFTQQIDYATNNNFTGYNFDNEDIIPLDNTLNNANYFDPLGNAVSYGFTTQLVRKRATGTVEGRPSYQTAVEWSAGQSYNFRELKKPKINQKPLSRVFSLINLSFDQLTGYVDYYYIPYQEISRDTSRHVYSTGFTYNFVTSRAPSILAFRRTVSMNYAYNRSTAQSQTQNFRASATYSLNDYIMPSVSVSYDMLRKRWQEANTYLTFQSPSECWKLDLGLNQSICEGLGWCRNFQFNLSVNLTGSGFGGVYGGPVSGAPSG